MDIIIKERLEEEGLVVGDLTAEELAELKEEIRIEQEGGLVLDGVLSPHRIMEIQERKDS